MNVLMRSALPLAVLVLLTGCGKEKGEPGEEKREVESPGIGVEVTFPDATLESAVRSTTGKRTGAIFQSDLREVKGLGGGWKGITNLSGLEHCTNLEVLAMRGNRISDLTPLAGLTNLRHVDVGANQIRDIGPLGALTKLRWLHLGPNEIRDITPLRRLSSLSKVFLAHNQISEITALVNNPGVGEGDTVDLTANPLSDSSIKEVIPKLEQRGVQVLHDKPK